MLTFWFRIACGRQTKLSHIMYKLLFNLSENGIHNAQWLITIKEMLRKYDLYDVWQSQNTMLLDALGQFKKKCKLKIKEHLYIQRNGKIVWKILLNAICTKVLSLS